ncbi:hypothetical protein F4821DRAFT_52571 [Hypoxylon rubiginosum]|uniref:Uncharacterized protein n=1 Tax=Hypoxylon rubiginosum TaxID=110542 RepID=A0ACC0DAK7_9PEZI|nr:hypothetical protein F4821DRAFT_52571 [Hypoxylon rubiginosum]
MASWYVGGTEMSRSSSDSSLLDDPYRQRRRHFDNKKRRPSYSGFSTVSDDFKMFHPLKRHRFTDSSDSFDSMDFEQSLTPPFFIIKEAAARPDSSDFDQIMDENSVTNPYYAKRATRPDMPFEHLRVRTSDQPENPTCAKDNDHDNAAKLVELDLADTRRRSRLSQHERILRSLICPKSREAEFDIDDVALQGIFYAANEIFFGGVLKGRVAWAWKDLPSCLIGTTALRRLPFTSGYETLIFLSRHILKDRKYNRRLLISTFIHELIHSYLFVSCGFQSRECGGHTNGFKRIAELIDEWAGRDLLYLCNMEAELSDFETKSTVLPKDPAFDDWGMPWSHDPTAGDYILLNRHQCRFMPAVRFRDRELA